MMTRRLTAVAAAVFLSIAGLAAQSSSSGALVVIVPGDKQYHQPSCAFVAKAGSKVKVSKQAEALRRGLKPHDCEAQGGAAASNPNAVKVYTQKDDNKYHTEKCEKLGEARTALTLDEAGRKFWPCPVCKPPIRQRVQKTDQ